MARDGTPSGGRRRGRRIAQGRCAAGMRQEELDAVLQHVRVKDDKGRELVAHAIVAQHDQICALQDEVRRLHSAGDAPSDRQSKALTSACAELGRLLESAGMLDLGQAPGEEL